MLARWRELPLRLMAGMVVWKTRVTSEKGQTMVEYGLILALIAVAVIVVLTTLGHKVSNTFNNISNQMGS